MKAMKTVITWTFSGHRHRSRRFNRWQRRRVRTFSRLQHRRRHVAGSAGAVRHTRRRQLSGQNVLHFFVFGQWHGKFSGRVCEIWIRFLVHQVLDDFFVPASNCQMKLKRKKIFVYIILSETSFSSTNFLAVPTLLVVISGKLSKI